MKTVSKVTMLTLLAILSATAFPTRGFASTAPQEMHVSCKTPNPDHETGLKRPKGDGNIWTFQIVLDGDAHFVSGPYWSYPGKGGTDPDWGLWAGGADGDSSLGWSSPGKTGSFSVTVNGKISCGDGGGGGGGKSEAIDFSAGWSGKVEFNAEIKVKRSGSGDDYSSSATVAAGGKSSDEHKADVVVIVTDDDDDPISGLSIKAPIIQNGDGVNTDADITPSSATSDTDGKANFTFTSSDIAGTHDVTLKEDDAENTATATIEQDWTQIDNGEKSDTNTDHYSWIFDKYFAYNDASDVTFVMSLNNTSPGHNGSIPIKGHSGIEFVTTQVSGYVWDDDTEVYVPTGLQDYEAIAAEYGSLVTYGSLSESSGSYTISQTVHKDDEFRVDKVYFDAVDNNADDGQ